jgi:hypothetical protein
MKLPLAILVYLVIGLFLGVGILKAVHGSYWLLIGSGVFYVVGFAWIGCLHH